METRILSIQSHVVSGYVGNKCYIIVLQILGVEVDSINSVQLSNHSGHKFCKGQVLDASDLRVLYDGLKENNLANYSHIATGYIGSKTFLEEVCNIVSEMKENNPSVSFNCDPVMGDHGVMYVPPELLKVYKENILPLVDVIFPNQFEAELLTDISIRNEEDICLAMDMLHGRGIRTVIITSTNLGPSHMVYGYISSISLEDGSKRRFRLNSPRFQFNFVGTGDLFTALFLGWSLRYPNDIKMVCSKVITSIQIVLQKTVTKAEKLNKLDIGSKAFRLELCLVDCIPDLMDPPCHEGIVDILTINSSLKILLSN